MPQFQYSGVDRAGKKVEGKLDAPSEGELRMILRGQGVRPLKISKAGALQTDLTTLLRGGNAAPVQIRSLATFTRQMHVLVASGIPLVQALEVLAEQSPDPNLRKIISAVKERVSQGSFFWESLNRFGTALPRIYVALIRAGEASGALDNVLDRLSIYLENTDRLRRTVKSAMFYPVLVGVVGAAVVTALLMFVVPKMKELITASGQELPGPTKFVIALSEGFQNNWLWITGTSVFTGYMLMRYIRTAEGRAVFDRMTFNLPLLGELNRKAGIARFTRTLGILLGSGVNLVDAIDICRSTVGNVVLEAAIARVRVEVQEGKTLSSILSKIKIFPKMAIQMVGVGEATGNLEKMLERTADIYESDVETLVGGLSKLIEPIMIVVIGLLVAGVMIAMYLPIFRMAGSVGDP